MKKSLISCLVVLAFCLNVSAQSFTDWVPLERLVKESDLIVAGTLRSVSRYTNGDTDYAEGIITIEDFVSDSVKTTEDLPLRSGDRIKLTWQNPSAKTQNRIELGGSENNQVIWILKIKSDGTVTADNLFALRAATERQFGEIGKALRKVKTQKHSQKVRLFNEISPSLTNQQEQAQNSNKNQIIESRESSQNSFLAAFVTILFSLGSYRVFYRNRFKIK